jgi:hypothetical protein
MEGGGRRIYLEMQGDKGGVWRDVGTEEIEKH